MKGFRRTISFGLFDVEENCYIVIFGCFDVKPIGNAEMQKSMLDTDFDLNAWQIKR
jgi:hypothetical protein